MPTRRPATDRRHPTRLRCPRRQERSRASMSSAYSYRDPFSCVGPTLHRFCMGRKPRPGIEAPVSALGASARRDPTRGHRVGCAVRSEETAYRGDSAHRAEARLRTVPHRGWFTSLQGPFRFRCPAAEKQMKHFLLTPPSYVGRRDFDQASQRLANAAPGAHRHRVKPSPRRGPRSRGMPDAQSRRSGARALRTNPTRSKSPRRRTSGAKTRRDSAR